MNSFRVATKRYLALYERSAPTEILERNINKLNGLGTILICRLLLDSNAKNFKCLKIASNVNKIWAGALTTKLLGDSWQLLLVLLVLLFGIRSLFRGLVCWLDYSFIL